MIKYTLRQLEYAVIAADLGSVAAAADRLGIAQPSISAAIKKLEDQIGLQLFVRQHAKGVAPSHQGAKFLAEARGLLAHAHDVEQSATHDDAGAEGELRIGSFVTLAPMYAPRLITAFTRQYPRARIQLEEGVQDHLFNGLRSGRIEIALIYRHQTPPDLRTTDIARLKPQVILPADHKLAAKPTVSLRDLAQEPFISLDIEPSRSYFLHILEQAGLRPKIAFSSSSLEMVRGMVAGGMGYSLLITRPPGDRAYDGRKLAVREIHENVDEGVISLAALKQMRLPRLATKFETFCVHHLGKLATSVK